MVRENAPVVRGPVDDEDDDPCIGVIAGLELDPSAHRLNVVQLGLALDRGGPLAVGDAAVPGAQVPGDWERDLAPESQGGSEEPFETGKELELCRVSHGRLVRVEPEPWAEAHRPRRATELIERGVSEIASLQPSQLPPRHGRSSPRGGQAHSPLAAGRSNLAAGRREQAACILGASVTGPFPGCHVRHSGDRRLADACTGRRDAGTGTPGHPGTLGRPPLQRALDATV